MVVLLVLLLLRCANAQFAPIRLSEGKKMTPEEFRKIPDDPMGDPADDIPPVPEFAKPGDSPSSLGLLSEFMSPRDRYLEEGKLKGNTSKKEERLLLNFQQIHDKLLEEQSRPEPYTRKPFRQQGYTANVPAKSDKMYKEKFAEFEPHSFALKSENIYNNSKLHYLKPIVWSTCDDFKRGSTVFNPEDIIDILWIPFYTWSDEMSVFAIVHKFTIPTQRQVYEYQKKYGPYLNRSIDWYQPKLYLEQDLGLKKAMLISADQTGLYYFIFESDVSEFQQRHKIIFPLIMVRLKIVGNYLAMMYCERKLTFIMAMDGHVPPTNKEKRETAKILGFRGKGRPVIRDEESEQLRLKYEQDWKNQLKAMKYLPTDGRGYLDALIPGETPMGRRKQNEEKISVIPDRGRAV